MSDITALTQLARFVGKSTLAAENEAERRAAVNGMVRRLERRSGRKKASDLLSAVLALSSRTRRMVQPRVDVDLDVFTPSGKRAVHLSFSTLD